MPPEAEPLVGRVGYVLKMYPRFSETFVVTELLQMQRLGVDLEVFSLRHPTDGRFHASLAELRAPVTYLEYSSMRATELWDLLRRAGAQFGDLGPHLRDLLSAEVRDVAQALELARLVRLRGISHLHAHFASVSADRGAAGRPDRRNHLQHHRAREGHLPRRCRCRGAAQEASSTRAM